MSGGRLVAWIEPKGSHFMVAFVSTTNRWSRDPATRLCTTVEEARRWIEQEAAALGGVPVVWESPVYASLCLVGEADGWDRAA
jgi:hypothetical protein